MADEEGSDDEEVQCALVEHVLGNVQTRKWTLALGQTYKVGKKDFGADIEIDHDSLSRRHCSIAMTRVEGELVLVVMDPGSTNGTFVDKTRLEKGVGLTKKISELRFISFGLCENGYRVLVRGAETNAKGAAYCAPKEPKAPVNKRGGPLDSSQKAQIEKLKRLAGPAAVDDDAGGNAGSKRERPKAPKAAAGGAQESSVPGGNRRERREAAARKRSRSRSGDGQPQKNADEEWREKAAKAKQMAVDEKRRRSEREERMKAAQAAGSSRRPESGILAYAARKEKEAKAAGNGKPAPEAADIEWPEDWA